MEELLIELVPGVLLLGEQTGAVMSQLHVMTDTIQAGLGALVGALAALAVIQGLKL